MSPLSSCELFAGLGSAEFKQLDRLLTVIDVAPGHVLGRQGQTCREFVVVLEGEVAVVHDGQPTAILPAASHIGAIPLLRPRAPYRLVSCHALGPARLAVATPREFRSLLSTIPRVGGRITALADRRQAYFDGLEASTQTSRTGVEHRGYPVLTPSV